MTGSIPFVKVELIKYRLPKVVRERDVLRRCPTMGFTQRRGFSMATPNPAVPNFTRLDASRTELLRIPPPYF